MNALEMVVTHLQQEAGHDTGIPRISDVLHWWSLDSLVSARDVISISKFSSPNHCGYMLVIYFSHDNHILAIIIYSFR